jgi:spermidine/putrescine transport system substrate-binding protein
MHPNDDRAARLRPWAETPMSRRRFVVGATVAGISLSAAGSVLAACGGGGDDVDGGTEPQALDTTLPKEITMLGWDEYMSPKAVRQFETQTGVKVRLVPYGGVPEGVTMLDDGEVVDVVMAANAYLKTLKEKGHLQPLQMDLLPKIANVTDEMLAKPPYDADESSKYSVPYMFGSTGFAARLDKVPDVRDSWDMLWDEKYKSGIGMIDDSGECVQVALMKLGKPGGASSAQDIEAATQALIEQKPLVKAYSSTSMTDDIKSGMPLRHCWDGDAIRAINEIGLSKIRYVLPQEGFVAWADTLSVHAKAPNPYAAHLFLEFLLDAKVAAENANWTGYQTAVGAADPYIESLVQRAMRPTEEDLARGQWIEVSSETTAAYEEAFKQVRAS